MLLIYSFFNRYFIQDITVTGKSTLALELPVRLIGKSVAKLSRIQPERNVITIRLL